MNAGVMIAVEVDAERIERRIQTRYLDTKAATLDEAVAKARESQRAGRALSIGLLGNAADVLPECVRRGIVRDLEETTRSIQAALRDAERMAGVKVPTVTCGIAGEHVAARTSTGTFATIGES